MDIVTISYWRMIAWCMATVGVVTVVAGNASAQSAQWNDEEISTFAEMGDWKVEGSGFSGVGKLETEYTPPYLGNDIGSVLYPLLPLEITDELHSDGRWMAAGVVRNESNYAYFASDKPGGQAVVFELNEGKAKIWEKSVIEDGASYLTAVAHPTLDVAYFGQVSNPVVDEVVLGAEVETSRQVSRRFDFSSVVGTATGGISSSLIDEEQGVAMFGLSAGGYVGYLDIASEEPGIIELAHLDEAEGVIAGMAIDPESDSVFFAQQQPAVIYSYRIATSSTLAQFRQKETIDGLRAEEGLKSIFLDREYRALWAITGDNSTEKIKFHKYRIEDSGTLVFDGVWTLNFFGGSKPLFDEQNRLVYLTLKKAGVASLVRFRLDRSTSAFPNNSPFNENSVVLETSPTIDYPAPLFSRGKRYLHLPSHGVGVDPKLTTVRLNPDNTLVDRLVANRISGLPDSDIWISGVRLYTHGTTGNFRLALYSGGASGPSDLIWESEELSPEVGWVSAEVPGDTPVRVPKGGSIWAAFKISEVSVFPSYAGTSSKSDGWISDSPYGTFPIHPTELSDSTLTKNLYSLGLSYKKDASLQTVSIQLSNGSYADWTNSTNVRMVIGALGGQPDVLEISEDPDFLTYRTYPASNAFPLFTFTPPAESSDNQVRIYVRARNAYSVSDPVSDTIGYDIVPPPKPPPPMPLTNPTLQDYVEFDLGTPQDHPNGSGFRRLEVQVRSTSSGSYRVVGYSTGGIFRVEVSNGEDIYCRVRGEDNLSNMSEWSEDSALVDVNADPRIVNLSILPTAPKTLDDVVPVYNVIDDDATYTLETIRWEKLDLPRETLTTGTLSASHTLKGQRWRLWVGSIDDRGASGPDSFHTFTILNSLPTQPYVHIIPPAPDPDVDLVVDVQTYSTDDDGDEIGYDFKWFKSTDGGATFIEKAELRGSPQVSKNFINEGDIWEVNYIPFERNSVKSTKGEVERIEGIAAKDRVYVGRNALPEFRVSNPTGKTLLVQGMNSTIDLTLFWDFFDADGEECFVDIYWTDKLESGLVPLAKNLPAEDRRYLSETILPNDRPIYIQAEIRDAKGAVVRVLTPAIADGDLGNLFMAY